MESVKKERDETKYLELETLENETFSILEKFGSKRKSSRLLSSRGSVRGGVACRRPSSSRLSSGYNQCTCRKLGFDNCGICAGKQSKRIERTPANRFNHDQGGGWDEPSNWIVEKSRSLEGLHAAARKIQGLVRNRLRLRKGENRVEVENVDAFANTISNANNSYIPRTHSLREAGIQESQTRLFRDDGMSTSHLRTSILNAFKTNRFDSIATMLAHESYGSGPSRAYKGCQILSNGCQQEQRYDFSPKFRPSTAGSVLSKRFDTSNVTKQYHRMVSPMTMEDSNRRFNTASNDTLHKKKFPPMSENDNIAIRDVSYTGFEKEPASRESKDDKISPRMICFNCWSAGQGKMCTLNQQTDPESMNTENKKPFCESWGITFVRQHYRSEDIEADQTIRLSSIRFAKDQLRRSAIAEHQLHPLFSSLTSLIANVNYRARRNLHVRQWFRSLVNCIKQGTIEGYDYALIAKEMQKKDTSQNSRMVDEITDAVRDELPKPPVTGYSSGDRDILHKRKMLSSCGEVVEVDIIKPKPLPIPVKLYQRRSFKPTPLIRIKMGHLVNRFETCDALINVITYGAFGKKPAPNNLSVGALSTEIVLSQKVETSSPLPYIGFHVIDSTVYSPECTPESYVPSHKSEIEFPLLEYIKRPLEHALNDRRVPPVVTRGITSINLECQQQIISRGFDLDHGFKTVDYLKVSEMNSDLDTKTFVPARSIVTLNTPKVLPTTPARVGLDYPICNTKIRDTGIKDLAHILKFERHCTPNKPQIFTVVTKQLPGCFMKDCDPSHRLGRIETVVTRSWSFIQKQRISMFYTGDGVPYYYDRRNGQIFWERPLLYDEESLPVTGGGVLIGKRSNTFVGDVDRLISSVDARANMRKMILAQHESLKEEIERDRSARSYRPNKGPHGGIFPCRDETKASPFSSSCYHQSRKKRILVEDEALCIDCVKCHSDAEILENIGARRIGEQYVHYIDSSPNLPHGKPVGRVKPRSAGKDWLTIGFDPWSAGKNLLTVEFIPKFTQSLSHPKDAESPINSNFVAPIDTGNSHLNSMSTQENETQINQLESFDRISRCIRHGNFSEFDYILNEADWKIPTDFTDDVGNTLLMLCCQNGNKRMVKVCLRKGFDLNRQNCNGQTCLHYAFGYGFGEFISWLGIFEISPKSGMNSFLIIQ